MTMAQGGLFNGYEEACELSTTDLHGQSQTRKAKYHRAYRSDPKNKDRINSQKKRRRALRKEKEMGNLSSMFESAAQPAKEEQQTIENALKQSDKASLPKLQGEASGELSDSSRSYCQEFNQPIAPASLGRESSSTQEDFQALLISEVKASFRSVADELSLLRREIKPTAPSFPKIGNSEQKANVSEIATTNRQNLSNSSYENQAIKQINKPPAQDLSLDQEQKTEGRSKSDKIVGTGPYSGELSIKHKNKRKPFSTIIGSMAIMTFLGFNTFFLVAEQTSLYESMSYSSGMAILIALLSEASLIMLSTMASWTTNLEWKLGLTAGMVLTVAVMVGILDSSAKSRVNTAARQSQEVKNIEKQLSTLRALEAPILTRIEKLDPQHYRTEISRLSSQLTTPPNGYSYKIEQLSNRLASINTAEADIGKLVWQRRVALLLNLLLSGFLGFLWSKNQSSVLTKIGRSMKGYWQRTCEAYYI